jgi:hypothetical protein
MLGAEEWNYRADPPSSISLTATCSSGILFRTTSHTISLWTRR